jgi:hypothetical protein
VRGVACLDSVKQHLVHGSVKSVQELQTADLDSNSELEDWRVPLVNYLKNLSRTRDRKIRRQALKYAK